MKKYAFFAHFNRVAMQRGQRACWTVHFRGKCMQAVEVVFRVPLKTRFVPDGRQPRATLRGYATRAYFDGSSVVVQ
jgi:hypothetical protein